MSNEVLGKRKSPRYHCSVAVLIYQGPAAGQARITNISRGGSLISPPLTSPTNPELRLSFRLSDDIPYINCKGEIVYTIADRGTGVRFSEISLHNQDLITDYFERQVGAERSASA